MEELNHYDANVSKDMCNKEVHDPEQKTDCETKHEGHCEHELEQLYNMFAEKFNLPSYERLDNEFELDLDVSRFILRDIRRKIVDVIEKNIRILDDILNPDSSIGSMYESQFIEDDEKLSLFELYKKLKYIERYNIEVEFKGNDESNAEFIRYAFNEWIAIKQKLKYFFVDLKKCWKENKGSSNVLEYFG